MKKMMGTTALLIINMALAAQSVKKQFIGRLIDTVAKLPIASAIIQVDNHQIIANEQGYFILPTNKISKITATSIGYQTSIINSPNIINDTVTFTMFPQSLFLTPLEVSSIRASNKSPFTKTNMNKVEIEKINLSQDIPFLLNQTPSVVANSDAGNGVGYTGIRIRGTDATRINVTLNGIPYNDAESMSTYFVDLPDFSSSVNSIQIQRGVGTSSNGAGAFGATINMHTNEFNEKSYTELNNSFGSFNTWKNTIKAGSGLINKHFLIDARLSSIRSDGYVDRANSNLQSFYLSTMYVNNKTSLRLNIFSGHEKTYQAWYGVDEATLTANRTFNAAGTEKKDTPYSNQTDNYTQTHYQLFLNHAINTKWLFNTALFLTRGKGYYEEYKADQNLIDYNLPNIINGNDTITASNLVRQRWLNNYFYGQIASLQYKTSKNEITIGGGWTKYDGKHYGNIVWIEKGIIPDNNIYYNHPANKTDVNIYTKWQYQLINNLYSFIDLQYRHVQHTMNGFEGNESLTVSRKFNFFNPKIGFSYWKNGWQTYISYALANKEPNRDDFQASVISQPSHETLQDIELGIEKKTSQHSYGATMYYMNYKNQLVLNGKINDIGAYTRINIPDSYRMGIELQANATINDWLNISGNFTLSKNKIKQFSEYIDNYDTGEQVAIQHENKDISFSANKIGSTSINFFPTKSLAINFQNKYVGKQYLDNTQNENRKLKSFVTQDIRAIYTLKKKSLKEIKFIVQANNIFNNLYEPNGYTFSYIYGGVQSTENYYYPMAGRNFLFAINIKL